jgi:hypothetical protein
MQVTFYKKAINSYDKVYDSPIMTFKFPPKVNEEEAVKKAIIEFQIQCKCDDWHKFADFYSIE